MSNKHIIDIIAKRARKTSVVVINESHERSDHRDFIARVLKRLRSLSYDTLAIETLSNPDPTTPYPFRPPFMQIPDLPFFSDEDGYYLSEAAFGRLGRIAKALDYRLLPYEAQGKGGQERLSADERFSSREEQQANNLAAFLRENPHSKLIVHVGYSHVLEVPTARGKHWMAARLKEKTGVDPLTVSQTLCRGGSATTRLDALPKNEPAGSVDLVVDHPTPQFALRRPVWRLGAGDRLVPIPRELYPETGWRVIEARPLGEPATSVPIDRVAIRSGETVGLLLPAGSYALRVVTVAQNDERVAPR